MGFIMTLTLRSFSTVVSTAAATVQASCAQILDMTVGTPARALIEGVAGVTLWLQYVALQVLARSRLATSQGEDCDSFVNDFGMTRLPGSPASGLVMMTSFSPAAQSAVVPPGVVVRTVSAVNFVVVADSGNTFWSASSGAYVRRPGVSSIVVPVQARVSGSVGNVAPGAICLMGTSVSGIDTVTNTTAFTNGSDAETDSALRKRFPLWLAAKTSATGAAVANAVAGVQTNLTLSLMDGQTPDGALAPGYFTAVFDDGSGTPADALVQEVYDAIDDVRALGVNFAVQRPSVLTLTISLSVAIPAGADAAAVQSAIETAITNDIASCSVGSGYAYSRIAYLAYSSAGVSVLSVTDVLLNGGQADIAANTTQAVLPGIISVSVSQGA
ncbi:hypothetical protein Tasa_048_195 [Tanticharoenia sakaeratensis NBRC 103193]|uniref:Baseplate protein J-like barrel domain-containing protein n=2 Tax=Tanticharoenia TaxID=444052 RepID=A0A0D6MQ93_9PROT|nr:hypothetical protein Tasa_048_195 [Tanticharoenia sakaeratensis NBRC 103193]GBQ21712.1 hypothetical protein AA103193_1818 [Tanticharoenia sakaeratensis NBRC 103193]